MGALRLRLANGSALMLDFREVAPKGAHRYMYAGNPKLSTLGGLSVAVPGELAGTILSIKMEEQSRPLTNKTGLEFAWKNYGSGNVTWKQIVTPSAELAQKFSVGALLAQRIEVSFSIPLFLLTLRIKLLFLSFSCKKGYLSFILNNPGLKSVYAPHGVALKEGERYLYLALYLYVL